MIEQRTVDVGDGDTVALHVYPAPAGGGPLVVVWPAMGVPARFYRPLATALGAHGFAVVVADLRGHGASTPPPSRASRYGYAELTGDVGTVLDALDAGPVYLVGHSLGGQMCARWLAAGDDPRVAGLVLAAVGLPYWRCYPGWRRRAWVALFTQGPAAVAAVTGVWRRGPVGAQARGVLRDWAYTVRHGRFRDEAGFADVTTPVLAVLVEGDAYTPPATTRQLTGKLTAAPVEHVAYTAAEAGGPLDHFAWVKRPDALAARVAAWAGVGGL